MGILPAQGTVAPARSLLDVFADAVAEWPDRVALDAPDDVLTYRELLDAAGHLAQRLTELGVGPADRVGVRVASGTAQLYVAILGVLMSGAAYVPVDADDPPARAASIWRGAGVCAVVGDGLAITGMAAGLRHSRAVTSDDDAWVIFTSGSTGEPKGVAVSHGSAAAFIDAESRLWQVDPHDRVLAGLSVAFDASCEEIWLAWAHGAALVPAPRSVVRAGADLGPWLVERRVSVISTVPSLAAMWDDDVLAGVRLLILGGEACPAELGWRLAAGREVWNTYGPTEATVVTTAAPIRPGIPITIGRPLEGWDVAVVDEGGWPMPFGETGELAIGGVGLGRYLDRALDAERFAALPALGWHRAYRTGDVVRETTAGLEFVGRRDDQVKLAGRRIELGEVDAQLSAVPGVRAAAAAVRKTAGGNSVLVGYVVGDVDPGDVRARVAERLPAGVAPLVVVLDALPIRTSGKVDRAALPWPPPPGAAADAALTGTEAWLAGHWRDQLGPLTLTPDSDFFELGGTSVAAAKLVSVLRKRFPALAVADVYNHRRLADLATRLDRLGETSGSAGPVAMTRHRRWGAVQLAGVFALLMFAAPQWVLSVLVLNRLDGVAAAPRVGWGWLIAGWVLFTSAPGRALIAIVARRALLRRLQPGRYPRRSWLGCRVWFAERLGGALHVDALAGTPWAARYARFLGLDVGAGARLATIPPITSLVRIGAGATIEADVDLHGWWIDGEELVIGAPRVGAGARVASRTCLMPDADIGAGAEIEPGSMVTGAVPANERWLGVPARPAGRAGETWPSEPPPAARRRRFWRAMFAAGLTARTLVPLAAAAPGVALLTLSVGTHQQTPKAVVIEAIAGAPLFVACFFVTYALLVAAAVRLLSRMIKPGWHGEEGSTGWALWFSQSLLGGTLGTLFPLYSTVFTRRWLRLVGIRVGERAEVSVTEGLNHLVTLGDVSFAADAVFFCTARSRGGWIQLAPIDVGQRTFLGNGAVLPAETEVGSDCLIGVLTTAPASGADETSWLGSPPLELPRVPERPDATRTVDPARRLVVARGATELVRILLPASLSLMLGALAFAVLDAIGARAGWGAMLAATPFVLLAGGACAIVLTVALKWLIMGRYRSGVHPLWSFFVWRDEIINSVQEQLAGAWLLNSGLATPLMSVYLRAMGAKVGAGVWCETLAITEFDVVHLEDGCVVNRASCVQTHLFHDRLLRIGPATLRAGSTLGPSSVVLPDAALGAGSTVGARSVVLRGEELPAGSRWHGAPVVAM